MLASRVTGQWEEESYRRGLNIPPPIPLRWTRADPFAGPIDLAVGTSTQDGKDGRPRVRVLPGESPVTEQMTRNGGLDELFQLYAGLGSGRIILMGPYGSGKSATAILLLLNEMDRRRRLAPDQIEQTPVPVLLQARNWDPRTQGLQEWFARQLATVYDILPSREYGPDPAGELVRHGRVALLLDGFDEMSADRRAEAVRHLNQRACPFRMVVMTRTGDFADLVENASLHLYEAIALELDPVPPEEAIRFLRNHQLGRPRPGDELQRLIDLLERHPEHPLSQAMDTPLNLSLIPDEARAVTTILDSERFQTRSQVEDFLVRRIIPRAYGSHQPPGPTPEEAEERLGFLATQMKGNDLDWRAMHHWAPAWERCLFNTVAGLLIMGGIGTLVYGPMGQYTVVGHTGTLFGLCYGAGMGAFFGFVAGLVSEARPPRSDGKHRAGAGRRWRRIPKQPWFPFNPAIGLFLFAVVTLAVGNQCSHLLGPPAYLLGVLAGVAAACAAGNAATVPRINTGGQRWRNWAPNFRDLLAALAVGLPIGLAYGVTKSPQFGVSAGVATGFTFGLMASVVRPRSDSDTPPSPEAHWLRDRAQTLALGLLTGIPIGLALGFQNGRAHGAIAGITATLGLGTIIALGAMAGISDIWRVSLLFLQLRLRGKFPLHGMHFLNCARERQVLRTDGPNFQFKHDRLRTAVLHTYQSHADPPSDQTPSPTSPVSP
jgi:hypothetical protein